MIPYQTGEICTLMLGPAALVGHRLNVLPHMPWSGDTDPGVAAYVERNAGKVIAVEHYPQIEYALQPVGSRRWTLPERKVYPAGVHDTRIALDVPWQVWQAEAGNVGRPTTGVLNGVANWRGHGTQEGERVAWLSLTRPVTPGPRPTIIMIHGGGWTVNSAKAYQQQAYHLAARGLNVVLVEYPLSLFGNFWHHDLEAAPEWRGPSFALEYIKSAVRWVNEHATAIGANGTGRLIAGTSAGGAAVLAIREDRDMDGLYTASFVSSGGGNGVRLTAEQYRPLLSRAYYAWESMGHVIRDPIDPRRTLAEGLAIDGWTLARTRALQARHIQAPFDGRLTLDWRTIPLLAPAWEFEQSLNVWPTLGNGLTYPTAIDAAIANDLGSTPLFLLVAEHEASIIDYANEDPARYLPRLGLSTIEQWRALPVFADWPLWGPVEETRLIFAHSVFHYPAWRISRAMAAASRSCWLAMWNFSSAGTYAAHSSDIQALFGNVEWMVGVSGDPDQAPDDVEARVTLRALRMSDGLQRTLCALAATGDPNGTGPDAWSLFETPLVFSWGLAQISLPHSWNVIGKVARNAQNAPETVTFGAFFGVAMSTYRTQRIAGGLE